MYKNDELMHYGVKGMKWGVRRYRNKDGSLTTTGKKRYSDEERKENSRELNSAIAKSKAKSSTGRPSAKEIYETSSTMKKFAEATKKDYKKRNDIYDGKVDVPKSIKKLYGDVYSDHDLRYYGYGKKFEQIMRKKASEIVYDKKDVDTIMALVEKADWDNVTDTYHDKAWLYWH